MTIVCFNNVNPTVEISLAIAQCSSCMQNVHVRAAKILDSGDPQLIKYILQHLEPETGTAGRWEAVTQRNASCAGRHRNFNDTSPEPKVYEVKSYILDLSHILVTDVVIQIIFCPVKLFAKGNN